MKIAIQHAPFAMGLDLTLFEEIDGKLYVYRLDSKGNLKKEAFEDGVIGKPTIFIPLRPEEIYEALDKAGFKHLSNSEAQGELKAIKYHLEDLRKLLKIK